MAMHMMAEVDVLFVAEAVTLAHVVRLVTLADFMADQGCRVELASDARYAGVVGPLRYPVRPIRTMPAERFYRAIGSGNPIFDFDTLARYVEDELALMDAVKPRVVVGDFRISLGISARLAGVPYVNITNAYWSPYARIRHVVPEFGWVRAVGRPLGQLLFKAFRRAGYAHHVAPVNRVRRLHGLPTLGRDFRDALTDGDLVCYADIPEIIPTDPLPSTHRFIGPIPWSAPVALPEWWPAVEAERESRPIVYVNLGSSGPANALQTVLDGLKDLPVAVVAATAGRKARLEAPANARVADFLPGDIACAHARLVLCNGGSPTAYQALANGTPVIGLATNMDQFLNMAAMEDAGCGRLVPSAAITAGEMASMVSVALGDPRLAANAKRIAAVLSACRPAEWFGQAVRQFLGRQNAPPARRDSGPA